MKGISHNTLMESIISTMQSWIIPQGGVSKMIRFRLHCVKTMVHPRTYGISVHANHSWVQSGRARWTASIIAQLTASKQNHETRMVNSKCLTGYASVLQMQNNRGPNIDLRRDAITELFDNLAINSENFLTPIDVLSRMIMSTAQRHSSVGYLQRKPTTTTTSVSNDQTGKVQGTGVGFRWDMTLRCAKMYELALSA